MGIREERVLSQRDLAKVLKMSNKTINYWGNDEKSPSLENAKILALFLSKQGQII